MATYRVPHHNVNIGGERIVEVIGGVQVDEVTKMVVHINSCKNKDQSILKYRNSVFLQTSIHKERKTLL